MINRKLSNVNGSLALVLDQFILEYYGINRDSTLQIELLKEGILVSNSENVGQIEDNNCANEPKSYYIKDFFKDGRLKIGDVVVYCQAAVEGKADIQDKKIQAIVEKEPNGNRQYLKYLGESSNKLYSFSGLTKKLRFELNLENAESGWLYNLNNEWMLLENKKKFSEL